MKTENVKKATLALDLRHNIVGIRFLDFQEDYENVDVKEAKKCGSFCSHVRNAMDGMHFKINELKVTCEYARAALGMTKPDITMSEGRSFEYCGLCETKTIAKNIGKAMLYIRQDIYGVEIGPLQEMEKADLVIIADYAETIMRVMQAYAYKYGNPEHLSCYGNQAMCSDMVSKIYHNNDINISLMCKGTRNYGRFDKGELSVGFPIQMFDPIVEGIIMTINPVHSPQDKRRIALECSENPVDLGIELDEKYNYGLGLKTYDARVNKIREK